MAARTNFFFWRAAAILWTSSLGAATTLAGQAPKPPNILIAIADDQSFLHTSIAGYPAVKTPAFDRVAREGVWFRNAFAASPGCSPSRAALLTGLHPWQLGEAGTHGSGFPREFATFPDLLERGGYVVGYTGKGWGPGNWQASGRRRNPAGPAFNARRRTPPHAGVNANDYAANFEEFLKARPEGKPFCFWYGGHEPHRVYRKGIGLENGKKLEDADPPPFLPDAPEVRSDILDYCVEIEWFDSHLGRMLKMLEAIGELDRTLVLVTSDNGMSFPRAKANLYEYGFHVPLAARWGSGAPAGRTVDDLVGFVDLTATILDVAGVAPADGTVPAGRSIRTILSSAGTGVVEPERDAIFASRERHSSARPDNLGYPQRAIRTRDYLLIRNFRPERWPAGDPVVLGEDGKPKGPFSGFADIDAGPTLELLTTKPNDPKLRRYLELAVAKRPAIELYHVSSDPGCLVNLASDPRHVGARDRLARRLDEWLRQTSDSRVLDTGDEWEGYPRYGKSRAFPPSPETLPDP